MRWVTVDHCPGARPALVGVEQAYDQFGLEEAAGEVGDVGSGESSGAPGGYGFDDMGFAEAGVVGALNPMSGSVRVG